MSQTVAGRVMPMIVVASVDAIRNFYVDTLGFSHVMGMVGKDGQFVFCTVVMGEARIMFMRAPGDAASPTGKQPVEIYLEVEDVDALHNRLKKKGVAISDPLTCSDHHRGQLLVYLRRLNVSVPSVYGPTADENPFADA